MTKLYLLHRSSDPDFTEMLGGIVKPGDELWEGETYPHLDSLLKALQMDRMKQGYPVRFVRELEIDLAGGTLRGYSQGDKSLVLMHQLVIPVEGCVESSHFTRYLIEQYGPDELVAGVLNGAKGDRMIVGQEFIPTIKLRLD